MESKIIVYYRGCYYPPGYVDDSKHRPSWFSFDMTKDNFNRIVAPKTKVINVFDTYRGGDDGDIQINCGSDQSSFFELMKILRDADYDDEQIIYIVESDYLHKEGWYEVLLEGFTTDADYVTLYDHLDKYRDYTDLYSEIILSDTVHWRTVPSTTNTWAARYATIMEDYDLHSYYAEFGADNTAFDHTKFLFLGERGRKIISSIPGYSTHGNDQLSPHTDWENQ